MDSLVRSLAQHLGQLFQVSLDVLLQEALWVLDPRLNDTGQGLEGTRQVMVLSESRRPHHGLSVLLLVLV